MIFFIHFFLKKKKKKKGVELKDFVLTFEFQYKSRDFDFFKRKKKKKTWRKKTWPNFPQKIILPKTIFDFVRFCLNFSFELAYL